jgi:hypothetical protein
VNLGAASGLAGNQWGLRKSAHVGQALNRAQVRLELDAGERVEGAVEDAVGEVRRPRPARRQLLPRKVPENLTGTPLTPHRLLPTLRLGTCRCTVFPRVIYSQGSALSATVPFFPLPRGERDGIEGADGEPPPVPSSKPA